MKISNRAFLNQWAWVLTIFISLIIFQTAFAKEKTSIPDVLKPWEEWVLHGKKDQIECIPRYNDSQKYQCAWPSELRFDLNLKGGTFTQSWLVNHETWAALPGNRRHWPIGIKVDGETVVIAERKGFPGVMLKPGSYTVSGSFSWASLPEHIQIPKSSGLIFLKLNKESIAFPDLDNQGRLWLKRERKEEKIENRLKIESYRLIHDSIPARVTLQISLDIAGADRQITLGPLYDPAKFTPVSLRSILPAKLEQGGQIKIQVRPGRFDIRLNLRHSGPLITLPFTKQKIRFWPKKEIWSFQAQPDLRLVEIIGGTPVDPVQTTLPKAWHSFPAYIMGPDSQLTFKEIKRGDPVPAPDQLTLDRTLWLKFDGTGYTFLDKVKGKKNTDWRLEMNPPVILGNVTIDGREQLITQLKGSEKTGIELRNGRVNFTAASLFQENIHTVPATGWDHDFHKVSGQLHLPPGWKLINASGIDNISQTWIKQWTLLDFFMVLIFTIALAKLYSKKLATIAFFTLVLIFHEPEAPRYIWLVLLIGFTLLKYLPESRFKTIIKFCQVLVILTFVLIVIPYSVTALRVGIFPQLAQPWTAMSDYAHRNQVMKKQAVTMDTAQEMAAAPQKVYKAKGLVKSKMPVPAYSSAPTEDHQMMQYDPNALTQTGPGLPTWRPFETVRFSWSGPVIRNQNINFTLIGPIINLVLAFVRVFLIILLILGMIKIKYLKGDGIKINWLTKQAAAVMIFCFLFLPVTGQTSEIPSQKLLEQLEQRLLEKDTCFPSCASIPSLSIQMQADHLSMEFQVDTLIDSAVPIPGNALQWLPESVKIDGKPIEGLFREKDQLWIMIKKGHHTITLAGPVRKQNTFQVPFKLRPYSLKVKAEGWSVEGIHPDGTFNAPLQFERILKSNDKQKEILETGILPPFAEIERTISLGLIWKVRTQIRRVSPTGAGMVMNIPLLPGESITTQGIHVENHVAKINLKANQTHVIWDSFIDKTGQIRLSHSETETWTEIWKVDVSPIFHMKYEGLPVILHKTGTRWYPTWHPWPGETLVLNISRPPGVEGRTLTIEKSLLELWPGRNSTRATLDLRIKSGQGGQHSITLPLGGELEEVSISGKIYPIRQNGQKVTLPIKPGSQNIRLSWMETQGLSTKYSTPLIDLGTESVNASVDVHLPSNRWPLFIGGQHLMGPAILFWSILILIVLVAFGLSRTGWASLKFHHWFLLCLGMSMTHPGAGILVVAWLVALDFRKKANKIEGYYFNLVQTGLIILTLAVLAIFVLAISNGLLGHPDMNIRGNGSSSGFLRWYHDVSGSILPRAWIISIPMFIYRIAMLAWALWISFWLVGILKWGWQQFSNPKIWHKMKLHAKKPPSLKNNR